MKSAQKMRKYRTGIPNGSDFSTRWSITQFLNTTTKKDAKIAKNLHRRLSLHDTATSRSLDNRWHCGVRYKTPEFLHNLRFPTDFSVGSKQQKNMLHFGKLLEPNESGTLRVHCGIVQPHKATHFKHRICRKNTVNQEIKPDVIIFQHQPLRSLELSISNSLSSHCSTEVVVVTHMSMLVQ